jgi:hypothetical protein
LITVEYLIGTEEIATGNSGDLSQAFTLTDNYDADYATIDFEKTFKAVG